MTMITPSYLGETIEYSSLHACRSTLEDPTLQPRVRVAADSHRERRIDYQLTRFHLYAGGHRHEAQLSRLSHRGGRKHRTQHQNHTNSAHKVFSPDSMWKGQNSGIVSRPQIKKLVQRCEFWKYVELETLSLPHSLAAVEQVHVPNGGL